MHTQPVADNLLNRQFQATAPDQAWVANITQIPTHESWLYPAVVMDLCGRTIVGCSIEARMTPLKRKPAPA